MYEGATVVTRAASSPLWARRWFWMEWLMVLDGDGRIVDGLERDALGGVSPDDARPLRGRFLEYPYDGCYYREIRPRGWHHLRQLLADFRREMPRWD